LTSISLDKNKLSPRTSSSTPDIVACPFLIVYPSLNYLIILLSFSKWDGSGLTQTHLQQTLEERILLIHMAH
jgi:hypothetical protein